MSKGQIPSVGSDGGFGFCVVAGRTAQLVRRVFVPRNPNKMRAACPEVVQAARDFIAAEAAPMTRLEVQAIYDALCFTAEHAGCVSDAHNTVADKIKALLPNNKHQPTPASGGTTL